MKLHLSDELALPLDAVTQTIAFLARKGAGKTYGASKLAEEMLAADAQVVVLDPVGVWYGLRLERDGKKPAFPIPVLGGLHGDIPLEPGAGALVAGLVAQKRASLVLDVSQFRKGDRKRFATDFAEELFHLKKAARSPVHIFVEEAQVFVPQRVMHDEARMLGAFEDLVKLGRNYGIGVTLISQRPQAVNKDALSQTEMLVVLQTNASQERKAIEEWIVSQGLEKKLTESLPSLERGEAWVWSPSWLRLTKRIRIGKKRTFDASATPEVGKETKAPAKLGDLNLEELRGAMAAVVEESKAKDPAALRKRIAELERELAKRPTAEVKVERVEVPMLKDAQFDRLEKLAQKASEAASALSDAAKELFEIAVKVPPSVIEHTTRVNRQALAVPVRTRHAAPVDGDVKLKKGMRDILAALALAHPGPTTVGKVGVLTGLSTTSGTWSDYVGTLRRAGLVELLPGAALRLTDAGAATPGLPAPPATHQEVLGLWLPRLKAGARRMLEALVDSYPRALTKGELGAAANIEPSSGTFSDYLGALRRAGIVEVVPDGMRASEALFPSGRAA